MKLTVAEIAEAVRGSVMHESQERPATHSAVNVACPIVNRQNESQDVPATHVVTGLAWDSRTVQPGDLYVALPGERVDGHDFAEAAVTAGAAAVLATRPVYVDVPVIVVADALQAVADLASYWRNRLSGTVIGLTGSTGKTTTKNLVRDVLSRAGTVVATKANQNNELGVPATLLAADEDTDFVVVEMGMRGLGQIAALCEIARPDWGLVTNVGESHIELLGSRQNIARAKAELLAALPEGGIAFVNAADELVIDLFDFSQMEGHGVTVAFFDGSKDWSRVDVDALGIFQNDNPFVWPDFVELDEEGRPSFNLCASGFAFEHAASGGRALPASDSAADDARDEKAIRREDKLAGSARPPEADELPAADRLNLPVKVKLALRGMHNVSNACSAAAVGLAAGLTLQQCAEALAQAQPEAGRQQVLRTAAGVTVVDDSYNANPDSMRASLATFEALAVPGRHIAVLGDMGELGGFSQECHERVGAYAGQSHLDFLICVGSLSEHIALAAVDAGMPDSAVRHVSTVEAALAELRSLVEPGDAVLVKASHFMEFERVVEGLVG